MSFRGWSIRKGDRLLSLIEKNVPDTHHGLEGFARRETSCRDGHFGRFWGRDRDRDRSDGVLSQMDDGGRHKYATRLRLWVRLL